jgi:hypothetical protein
MKILFIVPRYIINADLYEYSDDIILSLVEYFYGNGGSVNYKVLFYDVQEKTSLIQEAKLYAYESGTACLVIMHGPNPEFFLSDEEVSSISRCFIGFRLLIATDGYRKDYSVLLGNIITNFTHYLDLASEPRPELFRHGVKVSHSQFFVSAAKLKALYSNPSADERDIPVSLFGSLYSDRLRILLIFKFFEIFGGVPLRHFGGNYGTGRLPEADYIRFSKRSRQRVVCTLNWDGDFRHMKAHIYETLLTGALLLIDSPAVLPNWSAVRKEGAFVAFSSPLDLWFKVKGLLKDDFSLQAIASKGYKAALRDINQWERVLPDII